jgi:hypothetical protein
MFRTGFPPHSEDIVTQTVTGLFDSYAEAKTAVEALEAAGVPHHAISLIANNAHGEHAPGRDRVVHGAEEDAGKGAGLGAAIGGAGGLLAGLGLMAIPGLGPVVAAGWLASTVAGALGGAVVGGAAGGVVGALTHAGVAEEEAHLYAEGVRRGGTVVSARVDDDQAAMARGILAGAVDLPARQAMYRQDGWTGFDAALPAYTVDQIAAERLRYGRP